MNNLSFAERFQQLHTIIAREFPLTKRLGNRGFKEGNTINQIF